MLCTNIQSLSTRDNEFHAATWVNICKPRGGGLFVTKRSIKSKENICPIAASNESDYNAVIFTEGSDHYASIQL